MHFVCPIPSSMWILLFMSGAMCVAWSAILLAQRRIRLDGLLLSPSPALSPRRAPGDAASVCVIIPTRNDAPALARCLESVTKQDHESLSIMVVDDRSHDDTPRVIQHCAAADPRIESVRVAELPSGWLGKSHALWTGTRATASEWILFLDDDCRLHPAAVRTVIDEALRRDVQLVSLWPRHAGRSVWEHLVIPLCGGVIAMWFGGRRGTRRFANGQFLLVERRMYERIGGHRGVRAALIEDVAIARRAEEHGVNSLVASGRDLFAVRMYDGYRTTRDGWARIFVGALASGTKIGVSIAWLLVGSLLPYVALPLLAATVARSVTGGHAIPPMTAAAVVQCSAHMALMLIVSYRFWGFGHCRRAYLWLYPVSVVLVIMILARAWWWLMIRRSVSWRGTTYAIDRAARIAC